jgi:hypothetical protein
MADLAPCAVLANVKACRRPQHRVQKPSDLHVHRQGGVSVDDVFAAARTQRTSGPIESR